MKLKHFKRFVVPLAAILCFSVMAISASAHTVTADTLRRKVTAAVQPGKISYVSLYDVDKIAGGDIRNAAATALRSRGKVFFYFETLKSDKVIGRITVNPNLVKADAGDFNFLLTIESDDITSITKTFKKDFGRDVAVFKTNMSDYGMYVIISAKLDLGTLKDKDLVAYTYDSSKNTYQYLEDASCTVDEKGFLHLQTTQGGYVIITSKQ